MDGSDNRILLTLPVAQLQHLSNERLLVSRRRYVSCVAFRKLDPRRPKDAQSGVASCVAHHLASCLVDCQMSTRSILLV